MRIILTIPLAFRGDFFILLFEMVPTIHYLYNYLYLCLLSFLQMPISQPILLPE